MEEENHRAAAAGEAEDKAGPMEEDEQVGSTLTMERVAAAKQFIENHYRAQRKHIRQRKERSGPCFPARALSRGGIRARRRIPLTNVVFF